MKETDFSQKVNEIMDEAKRKISELNRDSNDKYAGKFYKTGTSAIAVIGKDKDGDLEYIEWLKGQEDRDFIVSLRKEYIYTSDGTSEMTVENSFGKEITPQQYREIMLKKFMELLDEMAPI